MANHNRVEYGDIGSTFGAMVKLARENGLTIRHYNETGELPRTFELVYRGTSKGEVPIVGNLSVDDVIGNNTVKHGLTLKQIIEKQSKYAN